MVSNIPDRSYATGRGFDTPESLLPIGAVAERTGVSVAALRAWEERYGFPSPSRSGGTHRRYTDRDVADIRRVVEARRAGYSLDRAIEQARADIRPRSIFSAVRERWPALTARPVGRSTMLAISRAIEDECCARAAHPVLVGAFQDEAAYQSARGRWRELARSAVAAIVLADLAPARRRPDGPVEIAIEQRSAVAREWAVVCDAPGAAAALVGWELTERPGRARSGFEAVWSVDPQVVRVAATAALAIAAPQAPRVVAAAREALAQRPPEPLDPHRLVALTERIVVDLDAAVRRRA